MQRLPTDLTELNSLLHNYSLSLHPAGVWVFDSDKKKKAVDAYRTEGLASNITDLSEFLQQHYPRDNMLKLSLNDSNILVIDIDEADRADIVKQFPSIEHTLTTTTSSKEKSHHYLLPPLNKEWTQTRSTNTNTGVDYLTHGVVFEGHLFDQPETSYSTNNESIQRASEAEYVEIEAILSKSSTTTSDSQLTEYYSPKIKSLVDLYLEDKPLDTKDKNKLCRELMNEEYRRKNKKARVLTIDPSYMAMNTIAVKLSMNIAIDSELRDSFMSKWIVTEWGFNLSSPKTRQTLKAIVPSLPTRIATDPDKQTLAERLDEQTASNEDDFALASTLVGGAVYYLQIDPSTMTPRRQGRDGSFLMTQTALKSFYGEDTQAMMFLAEQVTLVDNPFKEVAYRDSEYQLDYFNIAQRTDYERQTTKRLTKPDSALTRAIHSYFGEYEELYYHWLAHTTLAESSPLMIPFLVSTPNDAGGTGKTLCSAVIPTALVYAVSTITAKTMTDDWGDSTSSSRLVALNDLEPMSTVAWNSIYGKMRDETSQGMRRRKNMKYAGFVEVTDSYALALSANYIPQLDPHDRRAWVMLPQHLEYGDTEPVSKEDMKWLDHFAKDHLDKYYTEVADLMAYLRYLYIEETDKFKEELYRKAPETKGRDMAVSKGATHSEQIIHSMQISPESLFDLMDSDENLFLDYDMAGLGMSADNTVTRQQIGQVIVAQWYDGKVYLPKDFLAEIQHKVASSDTPNTPQKHTTLAKLCLSMGIDKEKFVQTAKPHHFTEDRVKEHKLPSRMVTEYAQRMIAIPMAEPTLELWQGVADGH